LVFVILKKKKKKYGYGLDRFLSATQIIFKDQELTVQGTLWDSGLDALPSKVSPHSAMLLKTDKVFEIPAAQVLRCVEVLTQAEFHSIPQDLRANTYFAGYFKTGHQVKRLPKAETLTKRHLPGY